jgi:hypothetical protein
VTVTQVQQPAAIFLLDGFAVSGAAVVQEKEDGPIATTHVSSPTSSKGAPGSKFGALVSLLMEGHATDGTGVFLGGCYLKEALISFCGIPEATAHMR